MTTLVTVARQPATSTKRGAPNFALTSETAVRSLNVWPPLALGAAFS
jgi:hypothetical protein